MGSQKSGIAFTSSFTLEVNGPKTFAKIPTGEVYNVDALMAMAAYTKSGEPLELKIDDLADWINHAKESTDAIDQLKTGEEKNETLVPTRSESQVNSNMSESGGKTNQYDTIKPGTIYYNKTLKSKLHKNKNGTSTLYSGGKEATDTVPRKN